MDDCIIISNLNDFVFCPASIYFHNLYGSQDVMTYQNSSQINGTSAVNLKQIKEDDFSIYNMRYVLDWKKSPDYMQIYLKEILKYKEEIFLYLQGYYRAVMKQKPVEEYPRFVYRG